MRNSSLNKLQLQITLTTPSSYCLTRKGKVICNIIKTSKEASGLNVIRTESKISGTNCNDDEVDLLTALVVEVLEYSLAAPSQTSFCKNFRQEKRKNVQGHKKKTSPQKKFQY